VRHLWLILALLAGAGLARFATIEPRPAPVDAPADSFSSARAMADVRVIAARPHPAGSPENRQVRDYLLGRMQTLGLSPRVQSDTAIVLRDGTTTVLGGDVENLIGVLPGRDRNAPALALMAHYDSAMRSPGAGDDAAGVAVALETLRAIKTRGAPARDVVVLLTDGEEAGLLGAQTFFDRDPLAAHIGLVINLEARGGAGRAAMFETSAGNGGLIAALQGSATKPTAGSLANAIYSNMPNDTDLTVAKRAGKAAMNFAFIDRQFDYHSPTATPANLHEGSVQSMGAEVLGLARDLAFAPRLPPRAPDVVFSEVFGTWIIAYPPGAGWGVLGAAFGLMALAVARAGRRAPVRWIDVAVGAGAALLVVLLAAGLLWGARHLTGVPFGYIAQLPLLARYPLWETVMGLTCAAALAGVAALTVRRDGAAIWLGVMAPVAVAALILQLLMPTAAYLFAWPLLVAALGAAASALGRDARWPLLALLAVLAAAGLGWLGSSAHFAAVGLDAAWLQAIFAALAAILLWPLLTTATPPGRKAAIAPVALLIAAAGTVGFIRLAPQASERHPQATIAYYVAQPRAGKFWLATPALNDWSRRFLAGGTGPTERPPLPPLMSNPFAAPARPVATPSFEPTLVQDADCTVRISAPWLAQGRLLSVDVKLPGVAEGVTVGGRPTDLFGKASETARFRWRKADAGLDVALRPTSGGQAVVRYSFLLDYWPGDAAAPPPRSASQMIWGDSDALAVIGTRTLNLKGC
jgi:hypothetical protein